MVAEIELPQAGEPRFVVVPPQSIRINAQGAPYLFIVKDDAILEQRPVRVAGYVGEGTAVSDGIVDGESVITSGTSMLEAGMRVQVAQRETNTSSHVDENVNEAKLPQ
jgi:multidrug efflux pump subunit AcrA (membrane-fusion protein)